MAPMAPAFSHSVRVQTAFRTGTAQRRTCAALSPSTRQCARLPVPRLERCRRAPVQLHAAAGDGNFSSLSTDEKEKRIDALTRDLKGLERERDDAIATGESCAKTSVRLTDMVQLLEKLALEKVSAGDDEAAKSVLREKASVKEMLDKANTRAQSNFALAAKIAEVIGQRQKEILDLAQSSLPSSPAYSPSTSSTPPPAAPATPTSYTFPASSTSSASSSYSSSASSSSSSSAAYGSSAYSPPKLKWEQSLLEARERLQQQEQDAQFRGRAARMSAEESIAAARERLRKQGESINEAQQRLRRGTEESIAEAQARLRKQEVEAMLYLQRLTERYRRGEYVPEDELDRAFSQLKRL